MTSIEKESIVSNKISHEELLNYWVEIETCTIKRRWNY